MAEREPNFFTSDVLYIRVAGRNNIKTQGMDGRGV